MRAKLFAFVLLTAGLAQAVGLRAGTATVTVTANSETPPAASPRPVNSDGITSSVFTGAFLLNGNTGYRLTVCAPSGQTLSGAGSLQIYYFSEGSGSPGVWSRHPSIDEAVTVTATSCNGSACRCQTFDDRRSSGAPVGWIAPVANGITLSGGTTVQITFEMTSQT